MARSEVIVGKVDVPEHKKEAQMVAPNPSLHSVKQKDRSKGISFTRFSRSNKGCLKFK